ncbi:MAG: DNA-processing protein DprA [Ignavibacteriales bacterium]|nr:DNA-processing protein DprA [Ignavibacteriales bacterium]
MHYLGNKEILNNYKIGFLCSRKVPANIILKTYDWAIEQRDNGVCIVSGFHSKIEKDVFDILIKGKQPIILVLARGMLKRVNQILMDLIAENRLLIISPFDKKITRPTSQTAIKRNKLIAEISDKIFIPYSDPNGNIDQIKNNYINKII